MRHKYGTHGIVLSRTFSGEANTFVTCITSDLGLVRARAQGVRRSGAKLAAALATFTESELVFIRGKESGRIGGAVLERNWFLHLRDASTRARAARVASLLERLVVGEMHDPTLFPIMKGFFESLVELPADMHEAAEILVVLRILFALGLDARIPIESPVDEVFTFTRPVLAEIQKERTRYIVRINNGIAASGL